MGRHEWKVAEFEGEPIINPDDSDLSWTRPKKAITSGDWEMWLVVGVSNPEGATATIIVQETSEAAPTVSLPWKNAYKLATWTIETDLTPSDVKLLAGRGMEQNLTAQQPFEPVIWHDGDDFRARFTPALVYQHDNTTPIDVTINGGAMDANTGEVVTVADEWWVKVTTDGDGKAVSADLAKQVAPANVILDGVVTAGEYYYKVCTFAMDGDLFIPTQYWVGDILWQYNLAANGEDGGDGEDGGGGGDGTPGEGEPAPAFDPDGLSCVVKFRQYTPPAAASTAIEFARMVFENGILKSTIFNDVADQNIVVDVCCEQDETPTENTTDDCPEQTICISTTRLSDGSTWQKTVTRLEGPESGFLDIEGHNGREFDLVYVDGNWQIRTSETNILATSTVTDDCDPDGTYTVTTLGEAYGWDGTVTVSDGACTGADTEPDAEANACTLLPTLCIDTGAGSGPHRYRTLSDITFRTDMRTEALWQDSVNTYSVFYNLPAREWQVRANGKIVATFEQSPTTSNQWNCSPVGTFTLASDIATNPLPWTTFIIGDGNTTETPTFSNAEDVFDTGTGSSTCEFTVSDTVVDPNPAASYWTVAVGPLRSSGLYYIEYDLDGEPTAASNDAECFMIGLINQTNDRDTTPFDTSYFGGDADEWGIYMQNGRFYNNGSTSTYLLNPDGTTWTARALGDRIGQFIDMATGDCWLGEVVAGVWTPFRVDTNPANISDPFEGDHPHFTATGTSFRFVIGDAQTTRDGQATLIPAASRATHEIITSGACAANSPEDGERAYYNHIGGDCTEVTYRDYKGAWEDSSGTNYIKWSVANGLWTDLYTGGSGGNLDDDDPYGEYDGPFGVSTLATSCLYVSPTGPGSVTDGTITFPDGGSGTLCVTYKPSGGVWTTETLTPQVLTPTNWVNGTTLYNAITDGLSVGGSNFFEPFFVHECSDTDFQDEVKDLLDAGIDIEVGDVNQDGWVTRADLDANRDGVIDADDDTNDDGTIDASDF